MNHYTARVYREDGWWMVHVPDVGLTQARWLGEAELMARELVAVSLELELEDVAVEVHVDHVGPVRDISGRASTIANERSQATALEREASAKAAKLARELLDQKVTYRDIGQILGISAQRVHQLVKD